MLTKVTMPPGGQNTDQLRVAAWRKKVGDPVRRGDILLEVETDKVIMEVESFAEGILLAKRVEEGSYATEGDVIAYIGNPEDMAELGSGSPAEKKAASADDGAATSLPPAPEDDASAVQAGNRLPASGSVKATPAAKKRIRDLGLSLAEVYQRAGKEILRRADVVQLVKQPALDPTVPSARVAGNPLASELIPLTHMRRTIIERIQESISRIPTFTAEIEVGMSACVRLRSELNRLAHGTKVSYHDIIAKCVAVAVADYPLVNASFTGDGIKVFRTVNIGLVVSLAQGLVVPVANDVGSKDIAALAKENAHNIAEVRSGKFDPRITEDGTITISNLGMYAISRFTAIINPPQACILAVGSIQNRAVWDAGEWREQPTASLTGTFDHRVVDGAYGAAFLTRLKEVLEHPDILL